MFSVIIIICSHQLSCHMHGIQGIYILQSYEKSLHGSLIVKHISTEYDAWNILNEALARKIIIIIENDGMGRVIHSGIKSRRSIYIYTRANIGWEIEHMTIRYCVNGTIILYIIIMIIIIVKLHVWCVCLPEIHRSWQVTFAWKIIKTTDVKSLHPEHLLEIS